MTPALDFPDGCLYAAQGIPLSTITKIGHESAWCEKLHPAPLGAEAPSGATALLSPRGAPPGLPAEHVHGNEIPHRGRLMM